jgi:predicted phage terminase large subunit-like protein
MKWGLIPVWAKDPSIGYRTINARSDTVSIKPTFRAAFRKRHCLVPASGFYEWKKAGKQKLPTLFRPKNGLFGFWSEFFRLPAAEALALAEAELARRSLRDFVKTAWQVIEPTTRLVWGWHLDVICEHLEAISSRQLRGLVIEVPPRSTKSTIVSVLWPAWEWVSRPQTRFLTASYSLNLAIRDAVRSRRVIASPWYRKRWGDFDLSGDQNVKSRYENDRTGYRLALSVGSGTTGEGGDITVIDDAHNVVEAESDAVREATIRWHDEAFYNRLNDAKTGGRVVIGQRVHERDLIGHLLNGSEFEELRIPEEFEEACRCTTSLGWTDPRKQDGELLRPERFGPEEVKRAKTQLGTYGYSAQYQQRPVPRGGGMFRRDWFAIVEAAPRDVACRVRYWDTAATVSGDWTVGVRMGKTYSGRYVVENVVRGRWTPRERDAIMLATTRADGHNVRVWVEQEPGSAGVSLVDALVRLLAGYSVHGERPTGDKVVRADALASQAEAGNVLLVAAAWNREFLDELCVFPRGAYDDQVDAAAGAFNRLAKMEMAQGEPIMGRKLY